MDRLTTKREQSYSKVRSIHDFGNAGDGAGQSSAEKSHATKMLDLFQVNIALEEALNMLAADKRRNDDISEAISYIELAKKKLKDFSDKLRYADHI